MECKECIGSKRAVNEIFADGTFTIKDCPACNGTGREVKQMTHEELLAKINRQPVYSTITDMQTSTYHLPSINYTAQLQSALRAVVEFHKWNKSNAFVEDVYICNCGNLHPCPTIQAIEKELGASD